MARRERRAYPSICKERATPPEAISPSRPPGCAAIGDGQRCSSVTEPCGYAPSSRLAHRQLRLQRDPPHLFHRLLEPVPKEIFVDGNVTGHIMWHLFYRLPLPIPTTNDPL